MTTLFPGATGWFEPIGKGTITVRLPYDVNEWNTTDIRPDYARVSGTDIIWHFTDLEPTEHDDISVFVLPPPIWRAIQAAQQEVDKNPTSAEAHLKLAHALMETVDMGRCALSGLGSGATNYWDQTAVRIVNEFQRAVELEPDNIDLHSDYVTWLYIGCAPSELIKSVLQDALAIDPNDPRLLEAISYYDLERFLTPIATSDLAQTPEPTWTSRPTMTQVIPSLTLTPTLATTTTHLLTPSPTTPPITLWAVIGAVVIGGAAAGVWVYRKRRVA